MIHDEELKRLLVLRKDIDAQILARREVLDRKLATEAYSTGKLQLRMLAEAFMHACHNQQPVTEDLAYSLAELPPDNADQVLTDEERQLKADILSRFSVVDYIVNKYGQ